MNQGDIFLSPHVSLTYPVILMGLKPRSLAALLTPPIAAGFGGRDAAEEISKPSRGDLIVERRDHK